MWQQQRQSRSGAADTAAPGQVRRAQRVAPKLQSTARHTAVTRAQVIGIVFRPRVLIHSVLLSPTPVMKPFVQPTIEYSFYTLLAVPDTIAGRSNKNDVTIHTKSVF